ncbi:MAG: zinc-ribbon domain-containing protein [Promethearchaeota archaeon]
MSKKIHYAYCKFCKKEVEDSSRKPLSTMQKVGWLVFSVITVGIGAIVYAIYLSNRPKVYCSTCFTRLIYSDKPFEKVKNDGTPLTAKEKVLKKVGKEKSAEKEVEQPKELVAERIRPEDTFCPYCGEDIKPGSDKCPYCGSALKASHEK